MITLEINRKANTNILQFACSTGKDSKPLVKYPFNTVDNRQKYPFRHSSDTFIFMTLNLSIPAKVKAFSITNHTVKYNECNLTSTIPFILIHKRN